jgi:hypothetical protein
LRARSRANFSRLQETRVACGFLSFAMTTRACIARAIPTTRKRAKARSKSPPTGKDPHQKKILDYSAESAWRTHDSIGFERIGRESILDEHRSDGPRRPPSAEVGDAALRVGERIRRLSIIRHRRIDAVRDDARASIG